MTNNRTLPSWPDCPSDEQQAALQVLKSARLNYWTGDEGRRFEREFADYHNRKHAVAVSNGTVALELALHALGIGDGDEVIVPSRTFVATASSVVMRGGRPVFADVDIDSQNITAETVTPHITPRTKAIICVHHAGWPCEMDGLLELCNRHGLLLIEDCAQAHGARYRGKPVGSLGDAAAFSYCQDKIMTTAGEGGMLLLDDEAAWRRAWSYKDHGKSWDAVYEREHPPGFRWLHESFGTNWRMTEVQSAIGRVQLAKLDGWITTRRRNAAILQEALVGSPLLRIPRPPAHTHHACYKFYTFVRPENLREGCSRDQIMQQIAAEGVPCFSGSCGEVYREKAFPTDWHPAQPMDITRELSETSLMLLVHPTLSESDMRYAAGIVRRVIDASTASQYGMAS